MAAPLTVAVAVAGMGASIERGGLGATCRFSSQPEVRTLSGGFKGYIWRDEPYASALFRDGFIEGGAAYTEYTAWLGKTIPRDFHGLNPFDQRACLEHQRTIFKNAGFPTHDWDVILNGSVGVIGRMNCVESILWGLQNKAHPQQVAATEFGAYILLDRHNASMTVYLQTGPTLSVPGMDWVDPLIEADLAAGHRVLTFLHLHPFDASNIKYQDCAGTCIPSGPDLNAFAVDLHRFKAEQAWITNGDASFRFPLSQLGSFNGGTTEIYRGG
mmetsp:Transcript_35650/g.93187  ORF Transcript_35650/g.93187 Transcript_35650/m.93187 type:complete len:271 (-) Transcript_35650:173-985(-)